MRTVTKTFQVFPLAELELKASEKAYEKWLESHDYVWSWENKDTLKAFEDLMDISVYDWQYDSYFYFYRFRDKRDREEISGIRLYRYLVNNYWTDLFPLKTYRKGWEKKRTSRILRERGEGVLTGFCMDDSILAPIYEFLSRPDKETTFGELIDKCLDSFFKDCRDDMEYNLSKECFKEEAEGNGWEFMESGELYN